MTAGEHRTRVLLVEDSQADAERIQDVLAGALPGATVTHVRRLGMAVVLATCQSFDVVLTALSLPDATGPEAVRRLRQCSPGTFPVIVLSGHADDRDAHHALLEGADDHLVTSELSERELGRSLRHAMARAQADEELRRSRGWTQSVLDTIEAPTCALDGHGRIVATNTAWDQYGARNGGDPALCGVGADYLAVCERAEEPEVRALAGGLRRMLAGAGGPLELEYACHSPQRLRWCRLRAVPVAGGGAAVLTHVDVTELKQARLEIDHASTHDALTGLANRRLLTRSLQSRLDEAADVGHVAVVLLDIDRFKLVNDGLGHTAGDALLVRVAAELTGAVRDGDLVARLGADEFAVLGSVASPAEATGLAERMQEAVNQRMFIEDSELSVTASSGLVVAHGGQDSAVEVMQAADAALHAAKAQGRSSLTVFSQALQDRARERALLHRDLKDAVDRDQFVLHYQPIVDSRQGGVHAVEALVRWDHPERGLLAPSEFLDVAESTGLIVSMGELVISAACAQGRRWHDQGLPLHVAVNLSARQVAAPQTVQVLAAALRRTGFPASALVLEVTETSVVEDSDTSRSTLEAIKRLGVQIVVDDFGTGYSSLTYLQRYPIDGIKIDRSFVRDVVTNSDDRAIAASLVRLGQDLGLSVVAEGVEQPEQVAALRAMGCELFQGFLHSRPLPPDAVADAVRRLGAAVPEHAAAVGPALQPRAVRPDLVQVSRDTVSAESMQRIEALTAQGLSLHSVAAALNAEGSRAPSGLRWHPRSLARLLAAPEPPARERPPGQRAPRAGGGVEDRSAAVR